MKTRARLIVADSEKDANMLYAVGMFVPDPFIYFEQHGHSHAVLSDLEIDRARKQARVDRVLSYSHYQQALIKDGVRQPRLADILRSVLRAFQVRTVEVPSNFPLGLAHQLKGIRVRVCADPFFPERERKSHAEIRALRLALGLAEEGMMAAMRQIRASRVGRDGWLYWRKQKLTSQHVQGTINATIARLGGVASHTIVAGGNQACDPHETGHGPLRAHQTIIVDIFPRDSATGYFGDITRTVVRGRASEPVKMMYALVAQAQERALQKLRDGVNGRDIHQDIQSFFDHAGFRTGQHRGRMQGFFHGTGHGLGLEIHEAPRMGPAPCVLRAGHVVTVEPGLYYPGLGGVRLEDVAVVGTTRSRNLTQFPKYLAI